MTTELTSTSRSYGPLHRYPPSITTTAIWNRKHRVSVPDKGKKTLSLCQYRTSHSKTRYRCASPRHRISKARYQYQNSHAISTCGRSMSEIMLSSVEMSHVEPSTWWYQIRLRQYKPHIAAYSSSYRDVSTGGTAIRPRRTKES
eukprot:505508-Rhodomonas_salina.1